MDAFPNVQAQHAEDERWSGSWALTCASRTSFGATHLQLCRWHDAAMPPPLDAPTIALTTVNCVSLHLALLGLTKQILGSPS